MEPGTPRAGEVFQPLAPRNMAMMLAVASASLGFIASVPLLLGLALLLLLLLAGSYVLVRLMTGTLAAKRDHPAVAIEGAEVPVRITLRATGFIPLGYVEVESPFPAAIARPKTFLIPGPLGEGDVAVLEYAVRVDKARGLYRIGALAATVSDPFGFFRRRFPIPVSTTLTVYPATFPIRHMTLCGRSASHHVGQRTTTRAGASEYFFGTREYRRGDPLRLIHWPSSARRRRLVVKEFELSVATEVTIFLDLSRATYRGLGRASTLERAVSIAASVAEHALHAGHTVGLIAEGQERHWVPQGSGPGHLRLLLEALTRLGADGDVPLREVLTRHAPRITRESSVVIIWNSIAIDYRDYETLFLVLKTHSVKPVAIFIDDSAFLRLERGEEMLRSLSVARREERERMKRAGIDVYLVGGDADPAAAFRQQAASSVKAPA